MKRFLTAVAAILLLGSMFSTPASAQGGYQVKGVVVDALGPVYGATVMEKGTTNGVSTGIDGDFVLKVSGESAQVEVSCIGYATQTFAANAVPATIVLAEDNEFLEEAVVIGYGSLSKKELSSSIVQVDKENLFKGSMNNPMEMITGKVAGLNVVTTAAANPNSSSSLQVRGATSIKAGNNPLIVIDGVPGGDIRNVTPQDIESMTVLKDAASAAIYGTRGANGVILITTKKGSGEHGKAHVSYDSYVGYNIAKDIPQVLTADEFRRSRRGTDYGASTDWYKLLLNKFSYELNQYASVDGSSESGSYNASVLYKKATGLDLTDQREEYGGRAAVEQRLFDNRFQVNFSINARKVDETYGNDGMFDTALSMNPTMPVRNPDGSYYQPNSPTDARNPYESMVNLTSDGHRTYLLGTAAAKWNIIMQDNQQLSTTLTYTVDYNDYKSNYYTPSTSGESYWGGYDGKASISYSKYQTNHLEWLFNYNLRAGDHSVQAVAGYSYEIYNYEGTGNTNYNFAYDNFTYNNIGAGTWLKDKDSPGAEMWSGRSQSKLIGVFGRINYNWRDLIMASASIRREGSSKFGANRKWGWFPAASIAWELANMNFIKDSGANIQSLKPRLSFGITGRSDFDPYQSLTTYSTSGSYMMDGNWIKGYAPSSNANPDLAWEKLVSLNLGLDFVVFDNRLRGSIDAFDRQTRDLLYDYTAPQPPFIYNTLLVNVGTTENIGLELSLDYDVFRHGRAFQWTTGINASVGKTRLKTLSNAVYQAPFVELYQKPGVGTNEYFFRIEEGGEIGQIRGYKYAGVSETTQEMMVYDPDGNPVLAKDANPAWKDYIGSTVPKLFLSWNNTFKYKNWDLNLFFTGAFGHKIFNMRQYGNGLKGTNGGGNVYRSAYTDFNYIYSGAGVISDFFLYDGSFFKLQNATLGYNFQTTKWKFVDSLRLYLAAKNVYTFTRYFGSDPSLVNSNGLTPGIDTNGAYPAACQITFGVTARF